MTRRPDKDESSSDLLRSMDRLKLRAAAAAKGDEAQLIALIDEIQKIRGRLAQGRDRLARELERATAHGVAIAAYARGARSCRSGRH